MVRGNAEIMMYKMIVTKANIAGTAPLRVVRVAAYYFHANVRATSQHTFERSCGHSKVKLCRVLKHSRESNRPVPGPINLVQM